MTETRCTCGAGHATFGECMRAKRFSVGYCRSSIGHDASRQKRWDAELGLYAAARRQGIQPEGTAIHKVRAALDASDSTGTPFIAEPLEGAP